MKITNEISRYFADNGNCCDKQLGVPHIDGFHPPSLAKSIVLYHQKR
jgi:hypothetical protein